MHFIKTIATSLLLAGTSLAQSTGSVTVHVVKVSSFEASKLVFEPRNVKAQPGEMVQFQFHTGNHSVAQSTFDKPCVPINTVMSNVTGFFSGFQPVKADATTIPTYTVMVNNTKPVWFYCAQGKHCQAGMVGAINALDTGNKTVDDFAKLAALVPTSEAPPTPVNTTGSGTTTFTNEPTTIATSASSGPESTGTTTTAPPSVSTGAAAGNLLASSQQVLTGGFIAALLSAAFL